MTKRKIKLSLVGIGTGNPDHLTLEAIKMMNAADLILLPNKGDEKAELLSIREAMCAEHIRNPNVTIARFDMPTRNPEITDYNARVNAWHDAIAAIWRSEIDAQPNAQHVLLLVWGDPSLYDSTLRITSRLTDFYETELNVVAGITAIQGLTAAHQIPINAINGPFTVTTGRRLRDEGWPENTERLVVMLDGECSFQHLKDKSQFVIYWSAYVGMTQNINISGKLSEIETEIIEARKNARDTHGWIMDIYLLELRSA